MQHSVNKPHDQFICMIQQDNSGKLCILHLSLGSNISAHPAVCFSNGEHRPGNFMLLIHKRQYPPGNEFAVFCPDFFVLSRAPCFISPLPPYKKYEEIGWIEVGDHRTAKGDECEKQLHKITKVEREYTVSRDYLAPHGKLNESARSKSPR